MRRLKSLMGRVSESFFQRGLFCEKRIRVADKKLQISSPILASVDFGSGKRRVLLGSRPEKIPSSVNLRICKWSTFSSGTCLTPSVARNASQPQF